MAEDVRVMSEDEGALVPTPAPSFAPPERRVKLLPVGEEQVLALAYLLCGDTPQFVVVPRMPNLPVGCKVEGVYHDHMRRSFLFLLSHPSFEAVPDGCQSPYVEEELWRAYTAYEIERLPKKQG